MPTRPHRRRPRFDPDERFSLPEDTDPQEALRKLLGLPEPVHHRDENEAEDSDENDREVED